MVVFPDTAALDDGSWLQIWTVYDHPRDYPDGFVARMHVVGRGAHGPTARALYGATLGDVRAALPPGLTCLARSPDDDPRIVESWI